MGIRTPWECRACGALFTASNIFDRHRVSTDNMEHPVYGARCLTEGEIGALGYNIVRGVWTTQTQEEVLAGEEKARQRRAEKSVNVP